MGTIKKINIGALLRDMEIYPRQRQDASDLNLYHVNRLRQLLRAGTVFPPIVADEKTLAVTDGWNRIAAYEKERGDDCVIDVELRKYKNRKEMFADAMRMNSEARCNLTPQDHARCFWMGQKMGLTEGEIAELLAVPAEELIKKANERLAENRAGDKIVLKGSTVDQIQNNQRGIVTKKQEDNMRKMGGNHLGLYVNYLIRSLDTGFINWENEKLSLALKELCEKLGEALKKRGFLD